MKIFISIVAIVLTFVGYVPYIRDTFIGKTRPHIFSWFIWCITTYIIYALQKSAGAGVGSYVTLVLAGLMFFIFITGLKTGQKYIRKIDILFLVLALISIPVWLIAKQPVISIIIVCTIDILGFIPTIRKSWNDPYSETLSLYTITTFRHILSILALVEYNIITWLFPVIWLLANLAFSIILIVRRKKIKNKILTSDAV
jgi:hypothetical protein